MCRPWHERNVAALRTIASTLATATQRALDEAGRGSACGDMLNAETALAPMPMPCGRLP